MNLQQIANLADAPQSGLFTDGRGIEINLTWLPNALTPRKLAEIARSLIPLAKSADKAQKTPVDETQTGQLETMAAAMDALDSQAQAANAVYCMALVGYVTDWDVEESAGVKLPLTAEGFARLPLGLPEKLFAFCRDTVEPKKKALTETPTNPTTPETTPPISPSAATTDTNQTTPMNLM